MSQNMNEASAPIPYGPSVETIGEDELETAADLVATMRKISETTLKDGGRALRSVHAKSHGILRGEMRVLDNLPETLAQGAFAKGGAVYPVVMRLSTAPGDILDDSVSTPRGLAVKVVGVEGDRLPGSEGKVTQDFVLVNGPAFLTPTAKAFLKNLKLLAATTDSPQIFKKIASAAFRGVESVVEAVGGESVTLKALGGHPETNILGETFYTQAALRHGRYIAKLAVAPISPELTALTDAPLNVNGKPNGLREAVADFFRGRGAEWEVRIQLCTDLEAMPVEDASVVWPEDRSPYLPVARIVVEPQPTWNDARSKSVDDGFSFSPWHGLEAHRPLGSVMRARQTAYAFSAGFRNDHNAQKVSEPTGAKDLPS